MTRLQFLNELNHLLGKIPEKERIDILYDYESHIQSAIENGKTEEEAVSDLGTPQSIANDILAMGTKEESDIFTEKPSTGASIDMGRAIFVFAGLLLFNLVFVVGPVAGIAGTLIGFYAASFACLITPIGLVINLFTHEAPMFLAFCFVLATTSFGYLFFLLTHFLAKWFLKILIRYWKFNVNLMKGGHE